MAGSYIEPRSFSSNRLVALMPSGSLRPAAFVFDPDEAVIAGVGDDLEDPRVVELCLLAGFSPKS